jgi:tRNA threonylcarbamoyladenosine biosynthesis protein TsaB
MEKHILCIETGTDTCSVGLARDGAIISLRESTGVRDHAARVAVFTTEVLAEAGATAADLSAVAVSMGPGSYTGLRIGVSFAKGLCYGLNIPLIGIGSLESLCANAIQGVLSRHCEEQSDEAIHNSSAGLLHSVRNDDGAREGLGAEHNEADALFSQKNLVPMIDARRMEVYGQLFDSAGNALTQPEAWIIDENSLAEWRRRGEVVIFGDGAAKCRETLPWARYIEVQPSARGMAALAFDAFAAGRFEDVAYFEPFYLKDFVITTSKKKLF